MKAQAVQVVSATQSQIYELVSDLGANYWKWLVLDGSAVPPDEIKLISGTVGQVGATYQTTHEDGRSAKWEVFHLEPGLTFAWALADVSNNSLVYEKLAFTISLFLAEENQTEVQFSADLAFKPSTAWDTRRQEQASRQQLQHVLDGSLDRMNEWFTEGGSLEGMPRADRWDDQNGVEQSDVSDHAQPEDMDNLSAELDGADVEEVATAETL